MGINVLFLQTRDQDVRLRQYFNICVEILCCFALLMFLIFALKVYDICLCLVLHEMNINKLTVY